MRVLVIGSGGREHALAWKLAQEAEVFVAPGNAGIAEDVETVNVSADNTSGIQELCDARKPDLVVIGPENPLIEGFADDLRQRRILVYGPGKEGAMLEGSKAFSKRVMADAGVPTARFGTFEDPAAAKEFAKALADSGSIPVIKASGNALGKGVIVANSLHEAEDAIDTMMVDHEFGEAGSTVVVEERLLGYEFSLLTICSGTDYVSLPVAQDYKRAHDGDQGPNTGGMGSYSPVPSVTESLMREAEESAVKPLLSYLKERGIDYRGTLFSGFMVQNGKPFCLEYNVRFGDPETQTIMRRIGSGLGAALMAAAEGKPIPSVEVIDRHAITVVLASGGYPGAYKKGQVTTIPSDLPASVKVFHAGTGRSGNELVTSGGRVLGVSAIGQTLQEARDDAYAACASIHFDGMFYRRDIGASPV